MSKPCPRCAAPMNRQSRICRQCYAADKARPANYLTTPCGKCAKPFTTHLSQSRRGQGRYCSRACARSGSPARKKSRPTLVCIACSRPFDRFASELKKRVGSNSFCSRTCWYGFNQRANHYGWTGGQHGRLNPELRAWRKAVIARDCYLCRLCHDHAELQVHHILPFGMFPSMRAVVSNGITLCRTCHAGFRNRELEYFPWLTAIAGVPLVVYEVPA